MPSARSMVGYRGDDSAAVLMAENEELRRKVARLEAEVKFLTGDMVEPGTPDEDGTCLYCGHAGPFWERSFIDYNKFEKFSTCLSRRWFPAKKGFLGLGARPAAMKVTCHRCHATWTERVVRRTLG